MYSKPRWAPDELVLELLQATMDYRESRTIKLSSPVDAAWSEIGEISDRKFPYLTTMPPRKRTPANYRMSREMRDSRCRKHSWQDLQRRYRPNSIGNTPRTYTSWRQLRDSCKCATLSYMQGPALERRPLLRARMRMNRVQGRLH
jgi:hypothetical protein